MATFGTGNSGIQRIPFVFLPLKGQIIHPSKEITFQGKCLFHCLYSLYGLRLIYNSYDILIYLNPLTQLLYYRDVYETIVYINIFLIVYLKKISFVSGVKTPICAVSGAQFLTRKGFLDLRNTLDADVPFKLFRDEGRTFLQVNIFHIRL